MNRGPNFKKADVDEILQTSVFDTNRSTIKPFNPSTKPPYIHTSDILSFVN